MNLDKKTILELPYIVCPKSNLRFLIDTGSTKSYVNSPVAERHFADKIKPYPFTVRTAHGRTEGRFTTLIPLGPLFDRKHLNHPFRVFDFHSKFDCLIGLDILKKLSCSLDFVNHVLATPHGTIKLNYLGSESADFHLIDARSVQKIKIRVNIEKGEGIIPYTKIGKMEIPESLVNIDNFETTVTILNPLNEIGKFSQIAPLKVEMIPPPLEFDTFQNFNHFWDETFKFNLQDLKMNHMNEKEKTAISNLVQKFSDIFSYEHQPLTHTDAIQHNIQTKHELPVYSRNYRFPEIYRKEVDRQVQEMLDQGIVTHSNSPYNAPIFLVPKKPIPGSPPDAPPRCRLVVDYRNLNEITIPDKYPLPQISELLDKLGRSQYFSVIDLRAGFHQIPMEASSQPKTAFSTPSYHLEFKRMPFGLRNAPSTFQRLMDNIMRSAGHFSCVYMDDVIVFSASLEEHIKHLHEVFKRLRNANLKVQLAKCDFFRKEVAYLGHIITDHGVKPNPDKIDCILKFPIPITTTQIKSFLGLLGYYRRFIPDFAGVTKPMTRCLKKGSKIDATDPDYITCFERCKQLLTNEPILKYPDFNKEFRLTTDASNVAIGAVLSQTTDGQDLPIAYASRTLNDTERRLSTIERELLGIVWGIHHFRPYLFGRRFKVFSDHQPLRWLHSIKEPSSKLFKWKTRLAAYDFEIVYKKGSANSNADALSRVELSNLSEDETPCLDDPDVALDDFFSKLTSNELDVLNQLPLPGSNSVVVNHSESGSDLDQTIHSNALGNDLVTIPIRDSPVNKLRHQIIVKSVNLPVSNPVNIERIFDNRTRITVQISKTQVERDIINFIKEHLMPKIKYGVYFEDDLYETFTRVLMKMFTNSQLCLTKYSSFLTDITETERQTDIIRKYHEGLTNHRGIDETHKHLMRTNYWPDMRQTIQKFINNCEPCVRAKYERTPLKLKYNVTPTASKPLETLFIDILTLDKSKFLTIVDQFSKFAQAYLLKSSSSLDVMDALINHCTHHGVPKTISLDNAPEFQSSAVREFALLHGINLHFVSSQHPESQGIVERFHGTLLEHIRLLNERNDFKRDSIRTKVIHALLAYNNSIHSALGKYTPFEVVYGHIQPNTLLDLSVDHTLVNNYLEKHKERMSQVYNQTRERLDTLKKRNIDRINQNRQDLPPIPDQVYVNTVQKQSKTKPLCNKETIVKINPDLKVAEIEPRHHNTVPKIHLANARRPKKFTPNLTSAWDESENKLEVLVRKYNLNISRGDLITLKGENWVNDNIINFYLELIKENRKAKDPTFFCFNTFLYVSFKSRGYELVKNYSRGTDIFEKDIILIPIFEANHWRLIVVRPKILEITYIDSLNMDGTQILENIQSFLSQEHEAKKGSNLDFSKWNIRQDRKVPQQLGSHECGVFVMHFADKIVKREPLDVDVHNIPSLRRSICQEILNQILP